MKKSFILLCFLLGLAGGLNAQSDFKPGFIITNEGDTLLGEIDNRGDLLMSQSCRFRNVDKVLKNYAPSDINAFRFKDGKYYISKEVNGNIFFLESLFIGKINIYYMRDNAGDHYYLDKKDVRLTEIPYEEGVKEVDGKKGWHASKKHIGLLSYYMKDAPELESKIKSIQKPQHENLIRIATDYHNAVSKGEENITYSKNSSPTKFSLEFFGGINKDNLTAFALEDNPVYHESSTEFGGYVYLSSPRISERIFFKTGFAFHKNTNGKRTASIHKIPFQLMYLYRAHKLQPRVSAGVNMTRISLNGGHRHNIGSALSLNGGVNYAITKSLSLTASINSDYPPLDKLFRGAKFAVAAYSFSFGLWVDL